MRLFKYMQFKEIFSQRPFFHTAFARHGRLVRSYFLILLTLIGGGLITGGLVEIYFHYYEIQRQLALQQDQVAEAAMSKIAQHVLEIEGHMKATAFRLSQAIATDERAPRTKFELMTLFNVAPDITEVAVSNPEGVVRVQLSVFRAIVPGDETDYSKSPSLVQSMQGLTFFSKVYFVRDSEPYISMAVPIERFPGRVIGILQAEVNLRNVSEIVRDIKVGNAGYVYIVARSGDLIAHPNIGVVLRRWKADHLDQVKAALTPVFAIQKPKSSVGDGLIGERVLSSYALIPSLDWAVIVENPLKEAYQPLHASVFRTSVLLLIGFGISLLATMLLARRVVLPLEMLRRGVDRISAGAWDLRLQIKTGDEIEVLGDHFNKMTDALQQAHSGLEQKIKERTEELSKALEEKSAIADVLQVMAGSPTDVQLVLESIVKNAVQLAGAKGGLVRLPEGDLLVIAADYNEDPKRMALLQSMPTHRDAQSASAQAFREGRAVYIHDAHTRPGYDGPALRTPARTILAVPMLRKGKAIGVISIFRDRVDAFNDRQLELVATLADEAVIAVESVNLFQELQTRSADLAQSVRELKALGEVSQAVSSTLDLPTVLTTIVSRACQLSGTDAGAICEYNEQGPEYVLRATYRLSDELAQAVDDPRIPLGETVFGRIIRTRESVEMADILAEPAYPLRDIVDRMGVRALVGVPLMREDTVVGALVVGRKTAGQFPKTIVELLKTFATQSVLAIQNARLFRDIEEKSAQLAIANQRLQELDKMKSSFVSNVSHELRTPLTAIEGLADNMLDGITGELNHMQLAYIADVKASADRLARLIDDLLDLSTIERGRVELKMARVSIDGLVHEVVNTLRTLAAEKFIHLETTCSDPSPTVCADRDKIVQVMTNLIGNALKFTQPQGKVSVDVHQNGDGWVQVSVGDTGPGIAPQETDRIFDEFYQITRAGKEKSQGVGLGLAISKKLVEIHDGKIWVESELEKGSTFSFILPVEPPNIDGSANY